MIFLGKRFDVLEPKPTRKSPLSNFIAGQCGNRFVLVAPEHRFATPQKFISAFQLDSLRFRKVIGFTQTIERANPIRLPDSLPHLPRLNEKFGLDNSTGPGFEIAKLGSAAALTADSLTHIVDLGEKIDILAGLVPYRSRDGDEVILLRPGDGPGTGQSL